MDPIYVTGHKNPDTDSIVAAMAYAALHPASFQCCLSVPASGQLSYLLPVGSYSGTLPVLII